MFENLLSFGVEVDDINVCWHKTDYKETSRTLKQKLTQCVITKVSVKLSLPVLDQKGRSSHVNEVGVSYS